MGFSINTYTYNGGAQTFPVSFTLGYLSRDDVRVRVNDAVDGSDNPVYVDFEWVSSSLIEVTPSLSNGDTVEISRTVSKSQLAVDFDAGADITPRNLSAQQLQIIMIMHELLDNRLEGELRDLADTVGADAIAAAAQAAADAAQVAQDAAQVATDRAAVSTDAAAAAQSAAEAETFYLQEADAEDVWTAEPERFMTALNSQIAAVPTEAPFANGELTLDMNTGRNFHCVLDGDSNVNNPANVIPGMTGRIVIEKEVFGDNYDVTWSSYWRFGSSGPPVLRSTDQFAVFEYYAISSYQISIWGIIET